MLMDRRDSRRFEPQSGRDETRLRHKGKSLVALLLDVSAEGFRICMHSGKKLNIGDEATLETCDGQHIVRVMHIDDNAETGRMTVGLARIEDKPLVESGQSLREQIRRRDKFDQDRLIDIGPIFAFVLLPLAIGISIMNLVVGSDGLKEIGQMITRQIGL